MGILLLRACYNEDKGSHEDIYRTPLLWAGCDTRSLLEPNEAGLNSGFFFFRTGHLTKAIESVCFLFTDSIREK